MCDNCTKCVVSPFSAMHTATAAFNNYFAYRVNNNLDDEYREVMTSIDIDAELYDKALGLFDPPRYTSAERRDALLRGRDIEAVIAMDNSFRSDNAQFTRNNNFRICWYRAASRLKISFQSKSEDSLLKQLALKKILNMTNDSMIKIRVKKIREIHRSAVKKLKNLETVSARTGRKIEGSLFKRVHLVQIRKKADCFINVLNHMKRNDVATYTYYPKE